MSDELGDIHDQSTEPAAALESPLESPPADEPAPSADPKDVEEGKAFAILSYALGFVGIPFFLVPLIMRNNEFALYHSKQCLILALLIVAGALLALMMAATVILLVFAPLVWFAACIALWVGCVLGIMASSKGEKKSLPLIGRLADDWFKGIETV